MDNNKKRGLLSQQAMLREAAKILESKDAMIMGVSKLAWGARLRSRPYKWHTVKMSERGIECPCKYCQMRKKSQGARTA